MMRHSSILLTILIAYTASSIGVMIPYKNSSTLYYSSKENVTITCSGTDEVTWKKTVYLEESNYTITAETPRRTVLQIKNATLYDGGLYECASTKNRDDFVRLLLLPDKSCFIDAGAKRVPGTSILVVSRNRSSTSMHDDIDD